ncbi:CaiB/BaiF CoA transferase family protein [Pseudonocardia pini]|uniref:CaiB/BaiF CoA transferase family protein n=1 Tax=Pseudonocardia pini TaxID=2758030 RepID=UPI001C690980|nr:CoA transferase [Pseudonocardia pini]
MSSAETFEGIRVLELTTTIAGPYSAMILADLGAEVIKVERPGGGDDARSMPPHRGTGPEAESSVFHAVNRNKRSIVLDLKDPAGREAFLRLAETADVVVQSYRPGAADKLGLGWADVHARNPRAVYCSVSAFGDSGAAAGLPGYDPLIQAFTGMMSMTGQPGGAPVRVAPSLTDLTTGMWAAMAIMAALRRRDLTGVGEHVEATLVDSGFALLCHQIIGMYATGATPGPLGSASPITAPYECFETSDGWVMIAAGNDGLFARLCRALGVSELLMDERFVGSAARVGNREVLHEIIQACVGRFTTEGCLAVLREAKIPVGPVHDLREAVEHPVAVDRGTVLDAAVAVGEPPSLPMVRLPIDDAGTSRRRPPRLGEHSETVLRESGFSDDEITKLLESTT